jgi:hypothetical protein
MRSRSVTTGSRALLVLGITWRAAVWSLAAGTLIGALYAGALGLLLYPFKSSFVYQFAASGAELGAIAGAVAALANSVALVAVTLVLPASALGSARHVLVVRRAAALATLFCGALSFLVLGPISLTLAGFVLFIIPAAIAARLAYALAPRAVMWSVASGDTPAPSDPRTR